MKILEKNGEFQKVTNDFIAETKVNNHGWRYATRSEWRESYKKPKIEKDADNINRPKTNV